MRLVQRFGTWPVIAAVLLASAGAGTAVTVGLASNSSVPDAEHVVAGEPPGDAHDPTTTTGAPASTSTTAVVDDVAPALEILEPASGAVLSEREVRFAGVTEPGAEVAAGPYAAEVGPGGDWSLVLVLSAGANPVTFRAVDAAGNVAEASVTVTYDAPAPPTTVPEEEPDACSAGVTAPGCDDEHDACAATLDCNEEHDTCAATLDCDKQHEVDDDLEVCAEETGACL